MDQKNLLQAEIYFDATCFILKFIFLMFFWRQRQRQSGRWEGAEERDTEWEPGFRL